MLATRKLLQMAGYQSSFTDGLLHIENYSNFRESKSYGIVFFFLEIPSCISRSQETQGVLTCSVEVLANIIMSAFVHKVTQTCSGSDTQLFVLEFFNFCFNFHLIFYPLNSFELFFPNLALDKNEGNSANSLL